MNPASRPSAMRNRPALWLYVVGIVASVFLIMPSAVVVIMSSRRVA